MPIYEYECTKCAHKMEALQKMSEKPLLDCPACGKPGLSKLVSAASFRLKGGGWYETDFKTGNKKQLAESESATSNNSAAEKSGSSPSKEGAKPAAGNETAKSKGTDSKKAPSKASSS